MISINSPKIRKYSIWIANLNPQRGTETGNIRPVLVIQTDFINEGGYSSTLIAPLTSKLRYAGIMRIRLDRSVGYLKKDSDIMLDQIRAVDNKRFLEKLGELPSKLRKSVDNNLMAIFDLE